MIDTIAGRNPNEVGIPYKVIVSTWDTTRASQRSFFEEEVQAIVERVPSMGIVSHQLSISSKEPVIVEIDLENRPAKVRSQSVE